LFAERGGVPGRTGGMIDVSVTVSKSTVGPAYAGHIVDVEVDKDTGKVTILRYTAIQDAGTAVRVRYPSRGSATRTGYRRGTELHGVVGRGFR